MNEMVTIVVLSAGSSVEDMTGFLAHARALEYKPLELVAMEDGASPEMSNLLREVALRSGPIRIIRTPFMQEMESVRHAINKSRGDYQVICRPQIRIAPGAITRILLAMRSDKSGWVDGVCMAGDSPARLSAQPEELVSGTRIPPLVVVRRQMIYEPWLPGTGPFPNQLVWHFLSMRVKASEIADPVASMSPAAWEVLAKGGVNPDSSTPARPRIEPGSSEGGRVIEPSPAPVMRPKPMLSPERGRRGRPEARPSVRPSGKPAGEVSIKHPDILAVVPLGDGDRQTVASILAGAKGVDLEAMVVGSRPDAETVKWIVDSSLRAIMFPEKRSEWEGISLAAKISDKSAILFVRPGVVLAPGCVASIAGGIRKHSMVVPRLHGGGADPITEAGRVVSQSAGKTEEAKSPSDECFAISPALATKAGFTSFEDIIAKARLISAPAVLLDALVFYPISPNGFAPDLSKDSGAEPTPPPAV